MDSEIVMDAVQSRGASAILWKNHQNNRLFSNPLVRDIALSSLDRSDKIVLAYGNQICLYRRLRFSDVIFCMVYALDKAKRTPAFERKDVLLTALKYDLHLMILKIGLNNFAASLYSILAKRFDQLVGLSPELEQIYKGLFQGFGQDLKIEDCQKIESIVSVRQLCAELLREIDGTTQQSYLLFVCGSQSKQVGFELL